MTLAESFYFKLAWKLNISVTYAIWMPLWLLWFFAYFTRIALANSLFIMSAKFGMAGPYFCYAIVFLLFNLAIILDRFSDTSKITKVAGWFNMIGIAGVHGFTSYV